MSTTSPPADDVELQALREAVRDLIGDAGGPAAARARFTAGPGFDEALWRKLGLDMGLAGLGLPTDLGGAGGGLAELTVVAEELGRALSPVPFLSSTVLAGQILAGCGSPVVAEVATGVPVSFAGTDSDGCWRADAVPVQARDNILSGTVDFVLDAMSAQHLVVAADDGDVYLVPADAPGVTRSALRTLDPSRSQATVRFDDAVAERLTEGGAGAAVVDRAVDVALLVLAAEQVGGAAHCLDDAVEYARVRHQFGRAIGSFQAIKHALADVLILVEMARSAIGRAVEAGDGDLAEAAAVAAVWCSEAYTAAAAQNVHVNGGTGFTWEHDAHLYFRRARADEALLGGPAFHRERLAHILRW